MGSNYPDYGVANAANTWFACTIVDARGKEVPWVDRDGRVLKTVAERYRPAPGQKFLLPPQATSFGLKGPVYTYAGPRLIRDLSERIQNGEFCCPSLPISPPCRSLSAGRYSAYYRQRRKDAGADLRYIHPGRLRPR